jgi:ribosomal-protein-alanine N-acetyltransferase
MTPPSITTPRLCLEHLQPAHADGLAAFFARNDAHFRPWDPPRPAGLHSGAHWREQIDRSTEAYRAGREVRWVMRSNDVAGRIVGRINFTGIIRGPFHSCLLGYQIDRECEGRGLMSEALRAAIDHAFNVLRLHRIEANHRPQNDRSARLLARMGFERVGLAPRYLFIDGAWRDHVINQLINPRFDDSTLLSGR